MDKNSLIILLGALIVVNFIALMFLGRSNKKTPKIKKDNKSVSNNVPDAFEEGGRTEFLGRPRGGALSQEKQQSPVQQEAKSRVEFEKIPELSREVKQAIIDNSVNKTAERPVINDTVLELPKPEVKIYRLTYMDEEGAKDYKMKEKEIIIGRDPQFANLIISSDVRISRKHARLYIREDKIFIEDMQSRNGTYVDNKRIENACEIERGKFRVGNTEIIVDRVK